MKTCFVAQPFDNDKFDKRFDDIFGPAIRNAGLEPYRVDKDQSVKVPIEEIENGIKSAEIVFVDITLDNPNVWYELGYAFACNKDVIMVCCTDERTAAKFPFDIQHRSIITYKAGSKSDFERLERNLTDKITAYLSKTKTVESMVKTPVHDTAGLESHEIAILLILMAKQLTPQDDVSVFMLKQDMEKAGYNPIAVSVGLRTLAQKQMIETLTGYDEYGQSNYPACRLLSLGDEWVIKNQHLISFKKTLE